MKVTFAILCALAAAAFALVFYQQQTIQQLRADAEALKPLLAETAPVRQQAAPTAPQPVVATDDEVHEMARLRGEVTRLRQQSNELAQAKQQVQALNQRLASEEAANKSAVATYQAQIQTQAALQTQAEAMTRRANALVDDAACINNLRIIDSSKQQWALENHKQNTDTPTWDDLRPYLGRGPNGDLPVCPDGGTYIIGTVGEKPRCSIPAHVLP